MCNSMCSNNSCSGMDSWWWIIIVILVIWVFCCNGSFFGGCGCDCCS